jgi:glycogen debranching enzyme
MDDPIRIMPRREIPDPESDPHLQQEWLVTNGLGGYASGPCWDRSTSEIFDAEPPYTARGCIAQAWSMAEVLRA